MTTPAERLFSAEAAFLRAEREVESLLDALYPNWQDFDHSPAGYEIGVYGVTPSPAAVAALHRAGFHSVGQHEHSIREFLRCCCMKSHQRPS